MLRPGRGASESRAEYIHGQSAWIPQHERLLSRWNLGLILGGVIMFLAGTIMQMTTARYPELNSLTHACLEPRQSVQQAFGACREAVLDFDRHSHRADGVSGWFAISEVLRHFGTAIVLAVIISLTVERQNRARFMDALASKTKELSLSVFRGMFNRDHPDALLTAVKDQILERDLVRDSLAVTYTLSLWEGPVGSSVEGRKFTRVDVILATNIRNVSTLKGEESGVATVPLGLGLPNPMVNELKPLVRVSQFIIGGKDVPQAEIDTANLKLQADLNAGGDDDVFVDLGERKIQPGESLSVSANYTMMKELEDTEVFRTLQISQSLTLTVVDNTGQLQVRAKAIHPSKLEKMASGAGTTQWRLSDIILPQQGIVVWWKSPVLSECP